MNGQPLNPHRVMTNCLIQLGELAEFRDRDPLQFEVLASGTVKANIDMIQAMALASIAQSLQEIVANGVFTDQGKGWR